MRRLASRSGLRLFSSTEEVTYVDRPFITRLEIQESHDAVMPMYRVMDRDGVILDPSQDPNLPKETCLRMYSVMNKVNTMDHVLYEVQRQGRVSFYMTSFGEEAMHVGSAAALDPTDWVYAQYREVGALMWRGFSMAQVMNQCYSNEKDLGKGRQMPVHYGAADLFFQTIGSTLTTQLPHAAGAAYGLKLRKESADKIAVAYFGEGAASEGDFHAALNMASTRESPVIFFCRNNGYAISTASSEQYRGDGIVSRAAGYGMKAIRVDGNDCFAVYQAVKSARQHIVQHNEPFLIEAMSYRVGHHSTSDDSTVYRTAAEVDLHKKFDNPIDRLGRYLRAKEWWSDEEEKQMHKAHRAEVLQQLRAAEKLKKPPAAEMFNDVYDEPPPHLKQQSDYLNDIIRRYPSEYDMTVYHQKQ